MIRIVQYENLKGVDTPDIQIRDHFRGSPENRNTPRFGLGPMRVLADTVISAGSGFPMHSHKNFEIVTFVCEGAVAHEDTAGNKGLLGPGDVQAMTTGIGVMHSEENPGDQPARVYQMWFHAEKSGLKPTYTDLKNPPSSLPEGFTVYASGAPHILGLIPIHQNVAVMGTELQRNTSLLWKLRPGRSAYLLAVDGPLAVNDSGIPARGGAEIIGEQGIRITTQETPTRVLLIDVINKFE
ncbi:MAG: pirin family protein [Pseudomonadota bacterium]|nr:pirin family protein [Pseudomonadota bacterium]